MDDVTINDKEKNRKPKWLVIILIVVAVVVVGIIAGFFIKKNMPVKLTYDDTREGLDEIEEFGELYLGYTNDELPDGVLSDALNVHLFDLSELNGSSWPNRADTEEGEIVGFTYYARKKISEKSLTELVEYLSEYYGLEPIYNSENATEEDKRILEPTFNEWLDADFDEITIWYAWVFENSESSYGTLIVGLEDKMLRMYWTDYTQMDLDFDLIEELGALYIGEDNTDDPAANESSTVYSTVFGLSGAGYMYGNANLDYYTGFYFEAEDVNEDTYDELKEELTAHFDEEPSEDYNHSGKYTQLVWNMENSEYDQFIVTWYENTNEISFRWKIFTQETDDQEDDEEITDEASESESAIADYVVPEYDGVDEIFNEISELGELNANVSSDDEAASDESISVYTSLFGMSGQGYMQDRGDTGVYNSFRFETDGVMSEDDFKELADILTEYCNDEPLMHQTDGTSNNIWSLSDFTFNTLEVIWHEDSGTIFIWYNS